MIGIKTIWNRVIKKLRFSAIRNSEIDPTSTVESGCNIVSVKMDRYSFCGYDCEIVNATIGAFCSIANRVRIGGAMHPIEWVSTSPIFYRAETACLRNYPSLKGPRIREQP